MQEQTHVGDDADGLGRAAVGSLVTTAGLMSTQITFTHDGSMLPTPMLCSIDESITTISTSSSASA